MKLDDLFDFLFRHMFWVALIAFTLWLSVGALLIYALLKYCDFI